MPAISSDAQIFTQITTIGVKPENRDELLALIMQETNEVVRHLPGYVSASLHTNAEATKIVNYSQWETREAWAAAMEGRAEIAPFARKVRELAESFDRTEYDVVYAHGI